MAAEGLPVERLREYLRDLPAGARALLVAELERAALRGDQIPGGDFLLHEVRSAARGSGLTVARVASSTRLVFRPLEPFLLDGDAVPQVSLPAGARDDRADLALDQL
jgi:hypothetical protein